MKLHTLFLCLALAACGKANDLPAMQAEGQGMVKNWTERFEDLERRSDAIMKRGNDLEKRNGGVSPEGQRAIGLFKTAAQKLESLKGVIGTATNDIPKTKTAAEMQKTLDSVGERLEDGYTEINADFSAVESWLTLAEAQPAPQVSKNETPAAPAPEPVDANGNPVR